MNHYEPLWITMNHHEPLWTTVNHCEPVWTTIATILQRRSLRFRRPCAAWRRLCRRTRTKVPGWGGAVVSGAAQEEMPPWTSPVWVGFEWFWIRKTPISIGSNFMWKEIRWLQWSIVSTYYYIFASPADACNGAQVEMKLTGGSSAARKKADRICLRCRRCRALGSQLSTFHNGHFQLGNMGKPELWGYASGGQHLLSLLFCGQLWSSPSSRLVWRPFASWHGKTLSVMGPRMLKNLPKSFRSGWGLGEEKGYFSRIHIVHKWWCHTIHGQSHFMFVDTSVEPQKQYSDKTMID